MTIDELPLSPRAAGFLADLGVKTVGDLRALPELRAPRNVASEIQLALEDLELTFPGTIVEEAPEVLAATGDVAERWRTIEGWLEESHPSALESFRPPAPAEVIASAESSLGRALPDDYKQFLALHDGQRADGPMVGTCSLFAAEALATEYARLHKRFDAEGSVDAETAGQGVRPVQCSAGWIPIGRSARGRDYLCIDVDPAEGGAKGQIIEMAVDYDDRPLVAGSFTELLSKLFEQLQTGEIELEDEE